MPYADYVVTLFSFDHVALMVYTTKDHNGNGFGQG